MKKTQPNLNDLLSRGNLIQPDELAVGMGVARVTIYQWARRGVIPHLKIENVIRFDPTEIKGWLETKRKAATKNPGPNRHGGAPDYKSGATY
jgi:excisionase family DNA binding protein